MEDIYRADLSKATKEKTYYSLAMFPYPSGAGLHVGHGSNFTANDIIARFKRMNGYTVINPMGWDSFGLPTENYAMKVEKPASVVTEENIAFYKTQCELMDWSYDWSREIATSSPSYYKWTQRIFQELYKAGLVYKKNAFVNRCPVDQTVLANDQVVDGCCERCGAEIIQKKHPQRFIKITDYADRLISDLDLIDRPEETKTQQKYWIGKSEGAEIDFMIETGLKNNKPEGDWSASNIIILHGYHDDANKGWRKWLTDQCEAHGVPCYNPQSDHENLSLAKDVDAIIAEFGDKINEQTIMVGYSLGGLTAKHLITKLGKKVKKLITVASSFSRTPAADDATDAALLAYRDAALDHGKLESLVGDHVAYFSKDDPAIPYETAIDSWQKNYPKATIRTFENKGHFNKHFGVHEIDELLEEIGLKNNKSAGDQSESKPITVFTTRPDTLFGVTALVLAPENASIDASIPATNLPAVEEYRKVTSKKTSVERQQDAETKSGVFSGVYAIHPLTNEQVPVWFADYVLPDYATGAVMFVPAHDERDRSFAKKNGLYIKEVVKPKEAKDEGVYTGSGMLINSGEFDGMENTAAKFAITEYLEKQGLGKKKTTFKLRDWSVSRQRYWGSPIPVYYTFDSKQEVPFFEYTDAVRGYKIGLPFISRHVVQCVVKDKSSDQFLMIKRKVDNSYNFIGGGVEPGEDLVQTCIREVQEEAGYQNVVYIKEIGNGYQQKFYHPLKNRNQYNIASIHLLEVDMNEKTVVSPEELAKHTVERMSTDEVYINGKEDSLNGYIMNEILGKPQVGIEYTKKYNAYNPHPDKAKWIPHLIPTEELPVILPLDLGNYKPQGKSPLADHATFPYYNDPDGNTYLRECDTLDTFMCSSFYFLRFADPLNTEELISKEIADKALPVDFYIGGKEHIYGHLLYSRFIHKFLYDKGYLSCPEPFQRLFHQGMILGPDGRKMSKRWGNVITPADLVQKYGIQKGADTLRTYTMFMGPLEVEKAWNDNAVEGVKKFLDRVERMAEFISGATDDTITIQLHKTIKGVGDDIEKLKFNTAVSKMMVFVNFVYDKKSISKEQLAMFLQLLAPFATKLTQEMRTKIGKEGSIHLSQWPLYDESLLAEDTMSLPIQIGGKMRGTLDVKKGISQDDVMAMIEADEKLQKYIEGVEIIKIIYVQDKIVNIIVK